MAELEPAEFGRLLYRYRLAAGLTQETLAERAHLSARGISDLERGVRQAPRKQTVVLLATALGLAGPERALFEAAARALPAAARVAAGAHLTSGPAPQATRAAHASTAHGQSAPGAAGDAARQGDGVDTAAPAAPAAPTPFVGRAHEVTLLEQHLAGSGPPALFFCGEPGIGKTRLLREALRRGREAGWTALYGGCQRRDGQEPYAPLVGALDRHIAHTPPAQLRARLRGCSWLTRLLPELVGTLREPLPPWPLPPAQERRLVFAAVARFLDKGAGPAGTLLVLDDVQWAGADLFDLLTALLRLTDAPVRVVGAYRDTEVSHGHVLGVALADLAHAGLATRHALAPLPPPDAARLLDALLEPGLVETTPGGADKLRGRVLERAGGIPFYVVSYAHGVRARALEQRGARDGSPSLDAGAATDADGATDAGAAGVPWTLAQGLRQRVAALPDAAREVLAACAVAGRQAARSVLVAVVGRPEEEVLAGLEAACRARLLRERGVDGYQFVHDVIREVVLDDLGAARRALLHRRVALALESVPGQRPVEALADHFGRSGDDDKAVLYLGQAGEKARAQAAHTAARGYYSRLVACLDALGRTLEAAGAREELGAVLETLAHYDAALETLAAAVDVYQARGAWRDVGRVTAHMGRLHADRGTPDEGVRLVEPVLARLRAHDPSHEEAMLHGALAHLFYAAGRYDAQLAAAEQATRCARALADDRLLAAAEERRGVALIMAGRVERGLRACEEAARLAEEAGDTLTLARALTTAADIYVHRGEFALARPHVARALELVERQGDPARTAFALIQQGYVDWFTGDWRRARASYERAVTLSRRIGVSRALATVLLELGRLCFSEGAWEEARGYVEECRAIAGDDVHLIRWAEALLAIHEIWQGQAEQAYARLTPLLDRDGGEERDVGFLLPFLAWAQLERGRRGEARAVVGQAAARARAEGNMVSLAHALVVRFMVDAADGRYAEASRTCEEALTLLRRIPYPYVEAYLLHRYGQLQITLGEGDAARASVERALDIYRRLGARRDTTDAERTLAGLALSGAARGGAGV